MKTALQYDFTVNKDTNTITVQREFNADAALVWDAYTKSEILDQWWAPKPWKSRTKSMDFREGGEWSYAMVGPEGEEHWAVAKYKEIKPKTKFVVNDSFTDENGKINETMPQSTWTVNFIPKGDMTLVKIYITYPDLAALEGTIQMGFKEGLAMGMENLDALLLTLKK